MASEGNRWSPTIHHRIRAIENAKTAPPLNVTSKCDEATRLTSGTPQPVSEEVHRHPSSQWREHETDSRHGRVRTNEPVREQPRGKQAGGRTS